MTMLRRELLGRSFNGGYDRHFTYLIDQGLEIDVVEGYQVQRVRVFFEDVRMLTLHLRRGQLLPWLSGLLAAFVGLCCFMALINMPSGDLSEQWGHVIGTLIVFLPFLLFFLSSMRPRLWLTVHGNRSKATMQWTWRRSRGEQVYRRLIQLIQDAQQAKRERIAQVLRDAPSAFAAPPAEPPVTSLSFTDFPAPPPVHPDASHQAIPLPTSAPAADHLSDPPTQAR